jgi:DNA-binding response OmpR family regulator
MEARCLSVARMKARILLLSADAELMQLRAHILRVAGYDTEHPLNAAGARAWLQEKTFDAIVICHTVSSSAAELLRLCRLRNPSAPVIAITRNPHTVPDFSADRWCSSLDDPDELLATIASAIQN